MQIVFKNDRQQRFFEDSKQLTREYGPENARLIIKRIAEMHAAPSLADIPPAARPHPLTHDRDGTFSVDLRHPLRLIFEPIKTNESLRPNEIKAIRILEVKDYH